MRAFLLRLLGGQPTRTQPEAALTSTDAPPTAGTEPDSTRDGEPATRTDVSAVADAMHKVARVQARMSLKLEDLEGKLEAGFQELRLHNSSRSPADTGVLPKLDAVFDAVDLLEEAARTARASGNSALSEGIASIGLRLVEFIEQVGLSRGSSRCTAVSCGGSRGRWPDPPCRRDHTRGARCRRQGQQDRARGRSAHRIQR